MDENVQDTKASTAAAALAGGADEVCRNLWQSLFYTPQAPKSVLICSADRHEGASTIACGLALAGTESTELTRARVALVDFNLRQPALHALLGRSEGPGISDVLAGGEELQAVAQRVNASLDLYAAGKSRGGVLDVIQTRAVEKFLQSLREQYDFVLVDVAAVNHFPDAQVLAGHVDQVALVAHAEQTPREAVAQAKKRLEAGGGKLAGLVLNMRTYPIPQFLYRRV